MAAITYVLCSATALGCACLLLRAYRVSRYTLLLWSGICFLFLTLSNAMLIIDRLLLPELDLSLWRLLPALAGMVVLLYGLIWHGE